MRVLLVTSWGQAQCGIQAHSEELIRTVEAADPTLTLEPYAEALDPQHPLLVVGRPGVVHLNYHRALHSRWTPDAVRQVQDRGIPVVITFHDTFGENPADDLTRDLLAVVGPRRMVIHEPAADLEEAEAIYWRQGVPSSRFHGYPPRYCDQRPYVGTVGFDFPWKNYDRLCLLAESVGWGVLLCTPEMSDDREAELRRLNPWLEVQRNLSTDLVIGTLRECDATAFLYVCGNSGTSAAIRLGIAAGKPVIAYETCRQFRDLLLDPLGSRAICWVQNEEEIAATLATGPLGRLFPPTIALAHQDSWEKLGAKYAALYREVASCRSPSSATSPTATVGFRIRRSRLSWPCSGPDTTS